MWRNPIKRRNSPLATITLSIQQESTNPTTDKLSKASEASQPGRSTKASLDAPPAILI